MGYLANFMVYTLAMIGVIFVALLVFKNATGVSHKNSSKVLKVHDTLSLGPRKTLYIVSAGDEKFLIAGDVDKTSLISKLNTQTKTPEITFKETIESLPKKNDYIDKTSLGIHKVQSKPYSAVMKNLAEKLR